MSSIKEQFLLSRVRAFDDHAAFERLYEIHIESLRKYLISRLPTREEAEDATVDTLERTYQYIRRTKVDNFIAVLITVARNVSSEYYRARARNPVYLDDPLTSRHTDEGKGARGMEAETEATLVKEAMAGLKEEEQILIIMRHFEGRSFKDIGERIGKSPDAARLATSRALEQLRELLHL
ncbi:sigma-70 family RNA polymerase sigma factor [Candidatus Uhrbacteria bacterium]|nr:sigma-70 family RNA polymerase sigma factor [Candidatus Uhrbacteria bacterium]